MSVTLTDGQAKALQNLLRDVLADRGRQAWPDATIHNAIAALDPALAIAECAGCNADRELAEWMYDPEKQDETLEDLPDPPPHTCEKARSRPDPALSRGTPVSPLNEPLNVTVSPALPDKSWPSPFDKRAADNLADEVAVLVLRGVIDSRSLAGDALLDYRNPPCSNRARELHAKRGHGAGPVACVCREMLERLVIADRTCAAEDMGSYFEEAVQLLANTPCQPAPCVRCATLAPAISFVASPPNPEARVLEIRPADEGKRPAAQACARFIRETHADPECDVCGRRRAEHEVSR